VELDALAPAISAEQIRIDGMEVRFRHSLARSAIHQSADLATRQRIHTALASIIQGQLAVNYGIVQQRPLGQMVNSSPRMILLRLGLRRGAAVAIAIDVLEVTPAKARQMPE
jgi:hypothetical protein